MDDFKKFKERGAGGSSGGFGTFLIGAVMTLAGGYMLTNSIRVTSGFWGMRWDIFGGVGISAFGATLIPFLIGIGMVFYDSDSKIGWVLSAGSFGVMIIGVLVNLRVVIPNTSLYVLLIMVILLVGGIGLMLRALRNYDAE